MEYDVVDIIMSDMETVTKEEVQVSVPEAIRRNFKPNKQGHIHPSKMTKDMYYDMSHANRGIALILSHGKFNDKKRNRAGLPDTDKDAADLKAVLDGFNFEVRVFSDLKALEIRRILYEVSLEDHSNNDCLLVTVISHGTVNGKIAAADREYNVQELWINFIGDNCQSLIGKPKLFFIQAYGGDSVEDGVSLNIVDFQLEKSNANEFNDQLEDSVIPNNADLLVMHSSAYGHYSFRNPTDGSKFIQALCEELKTNPHKNLICILTAVNRRVASKIKLDGSKQVQRIVSMLTKIMQFPEEKNNGIELSVKSKKFISNGSSSKPRFIYSSTNDSCYDTSNAQRGVAIIFIQENCNGEFRNAQKDGDDLKTVLEGLKFDVRVFKDLTLDEIREVLWHVSKEDHSNNDCFLLTILSLGTDDGKIYSSDWSFSVYELWENFVGDNCESLVGKPKLFFIEACRGSMVDPGFILKRPLTTGFCDYVDSNLLKPTFEISNTSDFLVMYSTANVHEAYLNPRNRSWFIQALCEELKIDLHEDLMNILTRVNKNVCYGWDTAKKMPIIVSMLTKNLIFMPKKMRTYSGRDRQCSF